MQASYGHREAGCVFCALEGSGRVLLENELALCIADADPVTPGRSLVIPRRHGADGLALHQPVWNAVVELIAERMLMNDVVKRFIGAEFNDIQCLTTNAFRFSSIRTWASNSWFSSGRTRSSRRGRQWRKSGCRRCDSPLEDQGCGGRRNPIVPAAKREIEAAGHPAGSSCRDGLNPLNSGKMGGIFKHRRNVFSLKIRIVGKNVRCTHTS